MYFEAAGERDEKTRITEKFHAAETIKGTWFTNGSPTTSSAETDRQEKGKIDGVANLITNAVRWCRSL